MGSNHNKGQELENANFFYFNEKFGIMNIDRESSELADKFIELGKGFTYSQFSEALEAANSRAKALATLVKSPQVDQMQQ